MKKLLALLVITGALFFVACNNEKKDDKAKTEDPGKIETTVKETPAATLVAHVCTPEGCKDGNHTYAHGEEGHTCTDACLKDHNCTESCKDGNHMYAHGEKGHTCAEACKNM